MRAVITGGTGMVGAALVRACVRAGHEVVVLVPEGLPRVAPLPRSDLLTFVDCDVRELDRCDASRIGGADAFFHLAWIGTERSERGLLQAQVDNVSYTLAAVDAASRLKCSVFVGAGSQAEYGRVEGDLCPSTATFPETGYGVAKLAAGQMSRLACHGYGMRHCWARLLSIYGPGDNAYTMVMQVISSACRGESPRCTKGEQLWDYLYCDDCGQALLAIAERGMDGKAYPVGSGRQRYLRDYIQEICSACNEDVQPLLGAVPYNEGQVMHLRADISELHADTGWVPRTSFAEGIRETVAWFKEGLGTSAYCSG